ncbi:hypothetical protein BGX38DRAFT_1140812 [Terfezia claveryi]|nr:hypothetical protein BGX38DRAFT_1140812 [Terfezia claveryi]
MGKKAGKMSSSTNLKELCNGAKPQPNEPPASNFHTKEYAIEQAWENYRQHRLLHWTGCNDYYCRTHGSDLEMKNRYPSYSICSICGEEDHGVIDCKLTEGVLAKEKEYRREQRAKWMRSAETTSSEKRHP